MPTRTYKKYRINTTKKTLKKSFHKKKKKNHMVFDASKIHPASLTF